MTTYWHAYLAFTTISLGMCVYTYVHTRDFLAPPVLFFAFYWLSYSSYLYQPLFVDHGFQFQVVDFLIFPVIISTTMGIASFGIAFFLVSRRISNRSFSVNLNSASYFKYLQILVHSRNILIPFLVFLVSCALFLSLFVALKGWLRLEAYESLSNSTLDLFHFFFRFYIPVQLLCVSIDSNCDKHSKHNMIILITGLSLIYAWYMGEREPLYAVMLCFLMYYKYYSNKTRYSFLIIGIILYTLIPITRNTYDYDFDFISTHMLEKPIPAFGSNILVYTNVAYMIPSIISYFYGKTYLYSLGTFIPYDPFELKQLTPARWFFDNYVYQTRSGNDFCLEAEAYMNFGWLGPPIVFFLLGLVYTKLYYSYKFRTSIFTLCIYPPLLLILCGAIRTHSLTTLKLSIGIMLICQLLLYVSRLLVNRNANKLH